LILRLAEESKGVLSWREVLLALPDWTGIGPLVVVVVVVEGNWTVLAGDIVGVAGIGRELDP